MHGIFPIMAQYYIHIDNGVGFLTDETGQDFVDFDAARQYAIRSGAEIISEELSNQSQSVTLTLYIEDDQHAPLATLPMRASMECQSSTENQSSTESGRPDDGLSTVPYYP